MFADSVWSTFLGTVIMAGASTSTTSMRSAVDVDKDGNGRGDRGKVVPGVIATITTSTSSTIINGYQSYQQHETLKAATAYAEQIDEESNQELIDRLSEHELAIMSEAVEVKETVQDETIKTFTKTI